MAQNEDEYFDELILSGAVEVAGIDEDGNFLYTVTDKMQEIDPEFKERAHEIFLLEVRALWQMGFLDMDPTSNNPSVRVTERIADEDAISRLSPPLRTTLRWIIQALKI